MQIPYTSQEQITIFASAFKGRAIPRISNSAFGLLNREPFHDSCSLQISKPILVQTIYICAADGGREAQKVTLAALLGLWLVLGRCYHICPPQ